MTDDLVENEKTETDESKELAKNSDSVVSNVTIDKKSVLDNIIAKKASESKDVKEIIDLTSTLAALKSEKTQQELVDEKTQELLHDATSKKISAESKKIEEEVERVRKQAQKEVAELEQKRDNLKLEVEQLNAETDKATAYYDSNKSILRCVGVREALSLKAMQALMVPAGFIFGIFQIILSPFYLLGFALEQIVSIIDGLCGRIQRASIKIIVSILVIVMVVGIVIGLYFGISFLITHFS